MVCESPHRFRFQGPRIALGVPPGVPEAAWLRSADPGLHRPTLAPSRTPSPRAARLALFGHAAAAVPASGRAAPRGRQREAGAPRGDGDACGRGSSPLPATGEAGDLGTAPPQRVRWLKRRSTRKPTRGASAAPPPWPTAPAACWRAWTSWSSGEAARGRGPGQAAAGALPAGGLFSMEMVQFCLWVDFPFPA